MAVIVALLIVYVVWGSTYLAIAVMIETLPPLLAAGARYATAGAFVLGALAAHTRLRPAPNRADGSTMTPVTDSSIGATRRIPAGNSV